MKWGERWSGCSIYFVRDCSCSTVKIARGENAFSEFFELDVSPGEGQSVTKPEKSNERHRSHSNPNQSLISAHARAKMLQNSAVERNTCNHVANAFLNIVGANLAYIQANSKMLKKMRSWQKSLFVRLLNFLLVLLILQF